MNSVIKKDLYRYVGMDCNRFKIQLRYIIFTPAFRFIYYFRKVQYSNNRISRLFWRILLRKCMWNTGIQIPEGTKIDNGFRIVHFGNIVINPSSRIGKNCNIAQGVLIGNNEGKYPGAPIIGNNVVIGANAIIIGGITIGNNVLIAPGAFINFNVPSNSVVIGNPGVIYPKYNPTKRFIVYPI